MMEIKRKKQQDVTLDSLTQEVRVIKDEFQEIKTLLKQIVAKR